MTTTNKGLKLGKETGSVMNCMMSANSSVPKVGEGATILLWTDRHAYTIVEVSPDLKKVKLQRCDSRRTDTNGMSESQEYDYSKHLNQFKTLEFKYGSWKEPIKKIVYIDYDSMSKEDREACFDDNAEIQLIEGKTRVQTTYDKVSVLFGSRREYHDYSF